MGNDQLRQVMTNYDYHIWTDEDGCTWRVNLSGPAVVELLVDEGFWQPAPSTGSNAMRRELIARS